MSLWGLLLVLALPSELGAWEPAQVFGEGDAFVVRVADWLRLAEAFTQRNEAKPDAKAQLVMVRQHLAALDLEGLYEALPGTGTKTVSVHGRLRAVGDYEVELGAPYAEGRLGDARMRLAVTPTNGAPYRVASEARMFAGLTQGELVEVADRLVRWLRRTARGCRATTGADPCDEKIRAALHESFPATAALVERYVEVMDIVAADKAGLRARLHTRVRIDALEKDYPLVAATIRRGAGMATSRARIVDSAGRTVLISKADSTARESLVTFPLDLDRLFRDRYTSTIDIDSKMPGAAIRIEALTITTHVERLAEEVRIVSTLRERPRVVVSESGLVDALIPSDVETLVTDFLGIVAGSDGGRGARWWTTLPRRRDGAVAFSADFEIGSPDFVVFLLKMLRRLRFEDPERVELRQLMARGIAAFYADFVRFQRLTSGDVRR